MRVFMPLLAATALAASGDLEKARDAQDRAAIEKLIPSLAAAATRGSNDAAAQYALAVAESYLSEVALELRDKEGAARAAESGIKAAERAVQLDPKKAEHHRILGALCGQVIPANVLAGIKHGKCALEAVNKALELDPKSAEAWMSHGVGNYYLPSQFGGGADKALADLEKALKLNPKSAEIHLWMGVVLRKLNRNADARKAFQRSLELNPNRLWAKQQLEKTPVQ
jgi:tetratricopeptide (TPR) repeat protein